MMSLVGDCCRQDGRHQGMIVAESCRRQDDKHICSPMIARHRTGRLIFIEMAFLELCPWVWYCCTCLRMNMFVFPIVNIIRDWRIINKIKTKFGSISVNLLKHVTFSSIYYFAHGRYSNGRTLNNEHDLNLYYCRFFFEIHLWNHVKKEDIKDICRLNGTTTVVHAHINCYRHMTRMRSQWETWPLTLRRMIWPVISDHSPDWALWTCSLRHASNFSDLYIKDKIFYLALDKVTWYKLNANHSSADPPTFQLKPP